MSRTRWLVGALLAVTSTAAGWAPTGAVAGRVGDDDGRPLGGARLTLTGNAGARTHVSAPDGGFRFDGVWPGSYRLEVDLPGYQWLEVRDLEVATGRSVELVLAVRATSADESVLLTGASLVDPTAVDLAIPLPADSRLPGDEAWRRAVPSAPDASDGAAAGTEAWLGAPAAAVATTLDGGPTAPAVRDLPPPGVPGETPRTLVWGGLTAAGIDSFGGAVWAVIPATVASHGALAVDWLDADLAAAAQPDPGARAGWRGPEQRARATATAAGAIDDQLAGFGFVDVSDGSERWRARPAGGEVTTDDLVGTRALDWALALDWHPRPRHRLWATASGRSDRLRDALSTVDRTGAVGGVATDTRFDADRWTAALQLQWLSVLSDRAIIGGRVNGGRSVARFEPHDSRPSFVDVTSDGRWGGAGGVVLGGAGFAAHHDRPELRGAALELAVDGPGGHRLQLAGNTTWERFERTWSGATAASRCAPLAPAIAAAADCGVPGGEDGIALAWGAGTRVLLGDDGRWIVAPTTSGAVSGGARGWTLELSDHWQARAPLTVAAGLRGGGWRGDGGGASVRWDARDTLGGWLGFAWDFEGRGRSRLYGQLGRSARPLAIDPDAGMLLRGDWTAYRVAGGGGTTVDALGTVTEVVRSQPLVVDPGLVPGHMDDAVLGVEYEVLAGVVVGAAGLRRRLADEVAAVTLDGGRSWLLTNAGRSVRHDPATGASLAAPVPLADGRHDLDAVVVYGRRRWASGWQLDTWLAWSHLAGNDDGGTLPGLRRFDQPVLANPFTPAAAASAGPLANDRRWRGHLAAAVGLGRGVVASAVLELASGAPRSRTGAGGDLLGLDQRLIGARGDGGRTPTLARLDGRLGWAVARLPALELALEVSNLLDHQTAVAADPRATVLGPDAAGTETEDRWGEPLIRLPPRTVSVAARWRF